MSMFYNLLEKMINRINASVKSVNGIAADDNGDVVVKQPANLLDNSYFLNPVNQREISGSISTAGYFIDRWKLVEGTVKVDGTGITLNGTICQILERAPSGKVTACASGGTASYDASAKTFNLTASGELITWAALYEGEYTDETMPTYMQKGYSTELSECYRYYWRSIGRMSLFGYTSDDSTLAYLYLNIPTKMRVTPTVAIAEGSFTLRTSNSDSYTSTSITGSPIMLGSCIRITVTKANLNIPKKNMVIGTLNSDSAILELSADL